MQIYLYVNNDSSVTGWGSTPSDGTIGIEVEDNHEVLTNPFVFKYNRETGELTKDDEIVLNNAKQAKDAELNQACQQAILSGFDYTINGISYHFSYDMEAQINFRDAIDILNNPQCSISKIQWTVKNNETGIYERIPMTKDLLDELTLPIFNHKNGCISKYRDDLCPKVLAAKTVEEVQNITWD